MTKLLVTGRTSFVGTHFVEQVLRETDWEVYSLERLPVRPQPCSARLHRFYHDLRAEMPQQIVDHVRDVTYMVHMAADVSGIKSLADPVLSVESNVVGTFNTLELARKMNLKKFIFMSTGEVVGPMASGAAEEDAPLYPSNPYAASKAAAEALVNSYRVSFEVPAIIVRAMNLFGPRQQLTRFVPMTVKKLLTGQKIICHVDQDENSGSRNWLHVEKFVGALKGLIEAGKAGETYHVVGPERSNQWVIGVLASALNVNFQIEPILAGLSHDLRYALSNTKLGDDLKVDDLEQDLMSTARWYNAHREALA